MLRFGSVPHSPSSESQRPPTKENLQFTKTPLAGHSDAGRGSKQRSAHRSDSDIGDLIGEVVVITATGCLDGDSVGWKKKEA